MYQTLFPTCVLAEPTMVLRTYSRLKIPVKGCMHATITHNGQSTTGSFVVVKSGTALLGLDLFVALHMCIKGDTVVSATRPIDLTVKCAPTIPRTFTTGCTRGSGVPFGLALAPFKNDVNHTSGSTRSTRLSWWCDMLLCQPAGSWY